MNYIITLSSQDLELISKILQEGPYKFVQPILEKIAKQVDEQNKTREVVSKGVD